LDKAPEAFRTISEVADEIDVPQHVLRFWESRFTQIRPMKRGGGRRYYRPDDVDLLRGVRHLLYGEGYTIRGVQRILRDQGAAFVQEVWRAGAEPPPPLADEDRAGDEDAVATAAAGVESRLSLFDFPSRGRGPAGEEGPVDQREPTITPASIEQGARTVVARRKLHAVLDELVECRRLIEAALSDDAAAHRLDRRGET
jgi:DNA-binding transcriptional MerR regulator